MPFTIKPNKKLERLLNANSKKGLVAEVRREFSKRAPIKIKQVIVQDMIRGISPVQGKGKWKKYSKSYKDVIRNKAAFRTGKNGKVIRFSGRKKSQKALIRKLNSQFHKDSSPTKHVSPVNLRHKGDLHKSLSVFTRGGLLRRFRLITQFKNKLADIHNRRGAGKAKVIRRLLPTNRGERFNKRIRDTIFLQLRKASDKIAKQFSRQ